jgi:hypothetical protein
MADPSVSWPSLVNRLTYKPGWTFKVGGPGNRFLCVFASTDDSTNAAARRTTQHMFEVPAVGTERDFYRWVFARLLDAERHEASEFFAIGEHRPFFPNHQDEGSPYAPVERWES